MVKTDNHNLQAKLDLRRYFLKKYHAGSPPKVFDCCQGSGVIWGHLKREFELASYWGVDLKPKKGRLKIDSVRVLQQSGWDFDVIDVDTYGMPWKHWSALLTVIDHAVTVFLTIGGGVGGGAGTQRIGKDMLSALQIPFKIPAGFEAKLQGAGFGFCLGLALEVCLVVEAVEAVSDGNAKYLGIRLIPRPVQTGNEPNI